MFRRCKLCFTMGSHGSEIRPLGEESIRRMVAEQAITDLSSMVKELVDNALDAESSTIKGESCDESWV